MGVLDETQGAQNPKATGVITYGREGVAPGITLTTEGNITALGDVAVTGAVTAASISAGSISGAVDTTAASIITGTETSTNVGSTRTQVPGITCSVPAAVGDRLLFIPSFMIDPTGVTHYEWAVKVGAAFVRYASTGTATPGFEGDPANYGDASFLTMNPLFFLTVEAGDLDGSNVVFALTYFGTGVGSKVYAEANYVFRWVCMNFGPA